MRFDYTVDEYDGEGLHGCKVQYLLSFYKKWVTYTIMCILGYDK